MESADLKDDDYSALEEFISDLVSNLSKPGLGEPRMMVNLYNILLNGIGLKGTPLTEDHIKLAFINLKWCNEFDNFQFIQDKKFDKLQTFIWDLFDRILKKHLELTKKLYYNGRRTIQIIFYILSNWCTACDIIQHLDPAKRDKGFGHYDTRFNEAFARINIELLNNTHILRIKFHQELPIAHVICNRLYHSAKKGIFISNCHSPIVNAILGVFSTGFCHFTQTDSRVLNFFYFALKVETRCPALYKSTFLHLIKLLRGVAVTEEESCEQAKLFKYLLCSKMLVTYKNILDSFSTQQTCIIIDYLNLLVSKTDDCRCFSKGFMASILFVVYKIQDPAEKAKAAELFIKIYRNLNLGDDIIFNDIIDFWKNLNFGVGHMKPFVIAFYNHLSPLNIMDELFHLIETLNIDINRYIAAEMVVVVFELMLQQLDTCKSYLQMFLERFDVVLESISCQNCYEHILGIFGTTDFEFLKENFPNFDQIMLNFTKYAIRKFNDCGHLRNSVLSTLMKRYLRCICYTQDFAQINKLGEKLMQMFMRVESELQTTECGEQRNLLIKEYFILIQKLRVIFSFKSQKCEIVNEFCKALSYRLFAPDKLKELLDLGDPNIDICALETLTNAIILDVYCVPKENDTIKKIVPLLRNNFVIALRRTKTFTMETALRLKTIFCCFISLHISFPEKSEYYPLKLNEYDYILLIDFLKLAIFEHTIYRRQRLYDHLLDNSFEDFRSLQRSLLTSFIELHSYPHLNLPVQLVWKVCIYYGWMENRELSGWLESLLKTLLECYITSYKYIMSQLIINLYKREMCPDVRENVIRAHKAAIFKNVVNREQQYQLQMDIILLVLETVKKITNFLKKDDESNRMEVLYHLNIFSDDAIGDKKVVNDILNLAYDLLEADITDKERTYVNTFIKKFARCSDECERWLPPCK